MKPHRRSASEQKKLADDALLLRAWRAWHRDERDTVLAGPHGSMLTELFRMVANLKHVRPSQLIGFVRSIEWSSLDYTPDWSCCTSSAPRSRRFARNMGCRLSTMVCRTSPRPRFRSSAHCCSPLLTRAPTGAQPGLKNQSQDIRSDES